ncbi:MAG: hypothetical protein M0R17_09465 [Candidatus Omnitrophica bacterium]|jgi:hypothetical protein|nr:hypothetical protein [Candidatus Omnitrophota bacterium]
MENKLSPFNLNKFIISVVIVGITLVLGIFINSTIADTLDKPLTVIVVTNESVAWVNQTNYTTGALTTLKEYGGFTVTQAYNVSSKTLIPLANITSYADGVIRTADYLYNSTNVTLSYRYTYTAESYASNAGIDVVSALSTGTSWISILVVVGFAVVVLTMLTEGLGGAAAGRREEIPYY